MTGLAKYWHTLRYLRPVQFYGRLWFRLYRPRPDRRPAPGRRLPNGHWITPTPKPVSMLGPDTFRFLNETRVVIGPSAWNDSGCDLLWRYNLHYFDDLNAVDSPTRAAWHDALLQRWVAENPPGVGPGWEPYPTSLRIVNWIKWALAGHALPPECLHSLAVQTRWLRRRLEYHLLGNHLFANAKALVAAGIFFAGDEAEQWRAFGQRLLARELREQILPDGGHFERSPMYHAILLEDVLDLINLAGHDPETVDADTVGFYRQQATVMTDWLSVMGHPDGEISFFNDAAMGIAPTLAELVNYGQRLRLDRATALLTGLTVLPDSGYIRLEAGPAVALLDVAPVGPDYLPGHAHADTLSFELSLFGQRVIVNGGTSRYGNSPERLAERGTAAHSTVQIDGADSSEVWGGFRVARRARVFAVSVDGPLQISAAHDGYRRLPGQPLHRRAWEMTPGQWVVTDTITGEYREAVACFHLHPAIVAEPAIKGQDSGVQGCLRLPGGQRVQWSLAAGQAQLAPSLWRPEFGHSVPTHCLKVRIIDGKCRMAFSWG
ncbi:MAG: alginate lyase family protein [Candidatus Competibacteraceae bacterium]|nr:MAG: alginate lyase family protein [Candidatus Competibacteraceae bacterium]